jgi:hypothetical protein
MHQTLDTVVAKAHQQCSCWDCTAHAANPFNHFPLHRKNSKVITNTHSKRSALQAATQITPFLPLEGPTMGSFSGPC